MVALACTDTFHTDGAEIEVPLLSQIELPDGSSFVPEYHEANCSYGLLKSLTLPTLGRIDYDWGFWNLPTEGCSDDYELPWAARTHGVVHRTFVDASGTQVGQWSYKQELLGPPEEPTGICTGESEDPSEVSRTKVTTPLGDYSYHFFGVWPNIVPASGSPNGFQVHEYGLPFDRTQPDTTGTRYLSSESYDSSSGLIRSTYVRYEYEGPCATNDAHICDESNRRLVSRRTVYHDDEADDGNRYADETFSDFDGLGHYRSVVTGGNFPTGNVRTAFTDYNPGHDLVLGGNDSTTVQSGYAMWPSDDPWVLGTFTDSSATEAGQTAQSQACFDPETGFLKRTRVLKGSTRSAKDLITLLSPDINGNPVIEKHYGGDVQAISTSSNLCGLSLPVAAYRKVHTYDSGALETSRYTNAADHTWAGNFYTVDLAIDPNTGLPSASSDVAGIETALEYDKLGRLIWVKPPDGHGAWSEYIYTRATATDPAKVQILQRANGSETGTILAQGEFQYDSFGRVAKERREVPRLDWVARETTYDGMGHRSTVSEWYDESDGAATDWTQFLSYDAFGRPGTIRPPDGASHDVTMSYTGDRVIARTVNIATAEDAETSATTTERYDRQGRLYEVTEPSGSDGTNVTNVTTSYSYDVGNRLSRVSTTSGVTQIRTFTYDQRGFLTSETHPEKTGAVTYQDYDALGNPGRKIDGASDLSYDYDRAERLTEIRDSLGDELPWKSFVYATANGANNWQLGKLQTATRYNRYDVLMEPSPGPDEIFASDFECGDLSGWNRNSALL